jgi:energy-converting hydrogenase A subunit R
MPLPKRVYVSDCEGPISKNDNAFELTSAHIPNGDQLFKVLSKYDDVQADVVRRPDYNAGDTLKLVLPFFKAFDMTNQRMRDFSAEGILLVRDAKDTLRKIRNIMPTFIVSTSYQQYISALCDTIDFPVVNTYSTSVKIDDYEITPDEKTRLQQLAKEISQMPIMDIPQSNRLNDFSETDRGNVKRLDDIIWEEIYKMEIGRTLREVKPVGGHEKAKAVKDIVKRLDTNLSDVMCVGDSITDEEAFKLVKEGGGLAVSFNGNSYAVNAAEIGIMSPSVSPMFNIAYRFRYNGKESAKDYVNEQALMQVLTDANREKFSKDSSAFRKTVRGEAIGKLG